MKDIFNIWEEKSRRRHSHTRDQQTIRPPVDGGQCYDFWKDGVAIYEKKTEQKESKEMKDLRQLLVQEFVEEITNISLLDAEYQLLSNAVGLDENRLREILAELKEGLEDIFLQKDLCDAELKNSEELGAYLELLEFIDLDYYRELYKKVIVDISTHIEMVQIYSSIPVEGYYTDHPEPPSNDLPKGTIIFPVERLRS